MEDKMQWEGASAHHKETWARLRGMITWGTASIVVVLLLMAATLTP